MVKVNPGGDIRKNSKMNGDTMIADPDGDVVLVLDSKELQSETEIVARSANSSPMSTSSIESEDNGTLLSDSFSQHQISHESSTTKSAKIRILVSSKHMSLVSPVFKAMLQGNFLEGLKLKETGKIELPLPEDDPHAWKILINIIHCRFNSVPLEVTLPLFTQLAVLVDKYQMLEVLHIFIPIWKRGLKFQPNSLSEEDLIRWICVAWMFNLADEFKQITARIQYICVGDFGHLIKRLNLDSLPIPQLVIDKIDAFRVQRIGWAIKILECTISQFQSRIPNCPGPYWYNHPPRDQNDPHTKWCDMMVHASLVESATAQQIYPVPTAPYKKWSFSTFQDSIKSLKIVTACFIANGGSTQQHSYHESLMESIQDVSGESIGLELTSLKAGVEPTSLKKTRTEKVSQSATQ
ncbi:hypothetical protein NHQ30_006289 [Ciborinia camelliae]|nr:hypothetical protein NHQ30_006289 [Ciborinia camelliae]